MMSQTRILVVDDNPTNIMIMEEILADDYLLESAGSGEAALAVADHFRPDIILLDIMMPGIDGYEVCRRIRDDHRLRHCKIIMVSAKAMLSERLKGYECGADDYLTKPFEEDELLAKVRVYSRLKRVEEMSQMKTNILSLLGHETRTPLNGILSPAEILYTDPQSDPDEQRMLAEMIYNNARRLNSLLEKVMLISALRGEPVEATTETVDLARVIQAGIMELVRQEKVDPGRFETTLADHLTLIGDPSLLKTALTYILHNACRYSPENAVVRVTADLQDGDAVVSVADRGPGIDEKILPHIFEEFTTEDVSNHTEGHGLSLAIANQIIRRHGGAITVSTVKDGGSTFTITLPMNTMNSPATLADAGSRESAETAH